MSILHSSFSLHAPCGLVHEKLGDSGQRGPSAIGNDPVVFAFYINSSCLWPDIITIQSGGLLGHRFFVALGKSPKACISNQPVLRLGC